MANTKMLLDNYRVSGTAPDQFNQSVEELADATEVISVKGKEITFLSLCQIPKYQIDGEAVFYILSEDYIDGFHLYGEKLRMGSFNIKDIGKELLEELKDTTGLMLIIDDKKYLISRSALTTLAQRACISGDTTVNRNNLARDIHLADGIFFRNERINFVYRHSNGVNKIFAAFSADFTLTKQDIVTKALKHEKFPFKNFSVKSFSIDNSTTELLLDLPGTGDFIPGIIIKNSDIGTSSLIVRTIYRHKDSYIIYSESVMRHDRFMSFDKFINSVLPEAKNALDRSLFLNELDGLKDVFVVDYSSYSLSESSDRENNRAAVELFISDSVYALLNTTLSKTKKCLKNICYLLADEIDAGKQYSYYDVAVLLASAPDSFALDVGTMTNIRKALANIPKYLSNRINEGYTKKPDA